MKVTLRSALPFRDGRCALEVEAVQVSLPRYPFATSLYATPYVDDDSSPTEQWDITDSVTGVAVSSRPYPSIEAAAAALEQKWYKLRLTERYWLRMQQRMLTIRSRRKDLRNNHLRRILTMHTNLV